MNKLSPLEVEIKRSRFADLNDLDSLKKLYSKKLPEISDLNTSSLWDDLNFKSVFSYDLNPMAWDRTRIAAQNINKPNIKVLNIGFGPLNLENVVLNRITDIYWHGIDISFKSVKNARAVFPKAKFMVGNITDLKYSSKYFDIIVCLEVLEHIPPHLTLKALGEINRVLKKAGKLIISVPLNEGLDTMLKNNFNPNAHVRVYTPSLIKAELQLTGFSILKYHLLYAFNKLYFLKNIIVKTLNLNKAPNNIILVAEKM